MFTPHSLEIALFMMITSAICWGSWANTFKGVKNYRFELFYWDYAVGIFAISLILALTLGSSGHDANSFLNNVHSADWSNIGSIMVGGAIFNLANLLLVAAIDMAGLAIAFPVSIGIALVVGTALSYILQPKGNAALLGAGVRLRLDRSHPRWLSLRQPGQRRAQSVEEKHYRLRRFRRTDGPVGSVFNSCHDARPCPRAVQHCRVSHTGSAAVLLDLECLLHEEAARRRTRQLRRLLSRARFRPRARDSRRLHLGHRHGLQSDRWQPTRASPSPTPSDNPRPWWPRSGES